MSTRINIELYEGDRKVKHFQSYSNATAIGVRKLCERGGGWLQSYSAALNEQQWRHDVGRADVSADEA